MKDEKARTRESSASQWLEVGGTRPADTGETVAPGPAPAPPIVPNSTRTPERSGAADQPASEAPDTASAPVSRKHRAAAAEAAMSGWSASVVGLKRKLSRALRLGAGPSALELSETLTDGDRIDKLALLRRVMAECPRRPSNEAPDALFPIVQTALADERDAHVTSYLVRVAGHLGGQATVRVLATQLGHTDARVVSNTLEALSLTGDETVFTLALPLIGREEPRVRATALAVLCRYDRTAALDAMVNFIKNARDPGQRHGALFALRAVGGVPLENLRSLQREVDDPEIQEALARILEETAPEGLPRLLVRARTGFERISARPDKLGRSVRIGRAIGLPAMLFIGLCFGFLGLALRLRPFGQASVAALPARGTGTVDAAAVAMSPAGAHDGTRVVWTGRVGEVRAQQLVLRVPGGEVLVRLDGDVTRGEPGDEVRVTGTLAGRSGLGVPYLDASRIEVVSAAPRAKSATIADRRALAALSGADRVALARALRSR